MLSDCCISSSLIVLTLVLLTRINPAFANKRLAKDLSNDAYVMFCVFFFCFFLFLIFFIKAYVVGTHLNCIDKLMQFRWVPTTYAFIKK